MLAAYRPIFSLLRGTAFLLAASGLHGLLLPLRGQEEGFSTAALGLMGTAWAGGFVAGCYFAPRLVRRAGHVRAFGTFAAAAAIIALLTGLWIDEFIWIVLRAFTGFAMAGAFMVIESWLNEKATNENRGTVFGLYMMVTFGSIMAGQMIVAAGDVRNASLFMVTGIFFCLSLIPTAVSTAAHPKPLQDVSLDLKGLYANSPVSFVACLLIGVANGAWGTLGAVYGARIGISTAAIALMMSLVVVAGAAMQMPMGRISDKTDRRFVLAAASFGAAVVGVLIFLAAPRSGVPVIAMTAAYGALAYTLYSLAVAHANDHARPEDFVKVSGGLLMLYGFGTMIGPVIGAGLMGSMSPESLFLATESHTGRVVGRLSSIGTLGAITATFATGFVLVATVPTSVILLGLSGVLALAGFAFGGYWRRRGNLSAAFAFVAIGVPIGIVTPNPCDVETAYTCASVQDGTLFLNGAQHSYVDVDDPTHLEYSYTQWIGSYLDGLPPGPLEVLHLGGGGFTLPRYVAATRPGSDNLVLELDPALVDLDRRSLGLRTGPLLRVETGDARANLRRRPSASRDVVIGDAFGHLAVPWHLTTRELVTDVRRVLRPGGVYALNVIDGPGRRFVRAEVATIAAVFPFVTLVAPAAALRGETGSNFVVFASTAPLRPAPDSLTGDDLRAFTGDATVLTDDYAPVDQLLTWD